MRRVDVCELRTVTVTATGELLLIIVVVRRGEEVTEDELRNVNLLLRVHLDRDTPSIVVDRDCVILDVNVDLDGIHGWVVDLSVE